MDSYEFEPIDIVIRSMCALQYLTFLARLSQHPSSRTLLLNPFKMKNIGASAVPLVPVKIAVLVLF